MWRGAMVDIGGMGGAWAGVVERASRTAGNSDMGRSSDAGRKLKDGSLRFARISAAWRAQRQRAAMVSVSLGTLVGVEVGMVGNPKLGFGEEERGLRWREIFSW